MTLNLHDLEWELLYFVLYNVFLCIVHTHVFGPNFPEKNVAFQFFHSMFYLYIKPMIIFQGIILYMDIIIAF